MLLYHFHTYVEGWHLLVSSGASLCAPGGSLVAIEGGADVRRWLAMPHVPF
jgi:hypothetical protein